MKSQMSDASQIRAFKKYPDFSDPVERERLSPAGIGTFVNIAKKWSLDDVHALGLLGTVPPSTLRDWKTEIEGRTLDEDTLMRISFLVGIFKALNICYEQRLADCWVTLPNQNHLFAGDTPVDYMIQHGRPGMEQVRRLLDARCAGQ
jgi:Protein of unknown function (DUF2384)